MRFLPLLLLVALDQQPTFRAAATTVEVDVVVTDAQGRFVSGLTAGDFVLEEDRAVQQIDSIRMIDAASSSASSPGEATAGATGGAGLRRFVWILDGLHSSPAAFSRVRDGLMATVRQDFRSGDVGGIVVAGVSSGLQLTSDRDALLDAIRQARPSAAQQSRRLLLAEWPRFTSDDEATRVVAGDRQAAETVLTRARLDEPQMCARADCSAAVQERARQIDAAARQSAQQVLSVIEAVTRALATSPARSTIVMVTEGFITPEMRAELDRVEQLAADARATIYVVDSRGVRGAGGRDASFGRAPDTGTLASLSGDPLDAGVNGLAAATGGRVIRNRNQFEQAFAEIAAASGRYYVLAYRPARAATAAEWRRLAVRVTRPGLSVSARRGYRARPELTATREVGEVAVAVPTPAAAPPSHERPVAPVLPDPTRTEDVEELRAVASRSVPPAAEARAQEGWQAYQRGDVTTARALLDALPVEDAPVWAAYVLGLSEFALGSASAAAAAWERVRNAAPDFAQAYFDLTDAYISSGDLRSASDVLRTAAERWPSDADVWNATGVVHLRRGAVDEAITAFERATSVAAEEGIGFYNLGRGLELRYEKMRRWSRIDRSWVANRSDLAAALLAYERAAALPGPAREAAQQALVRLRQ